MKTLFCLLFTLLAMASACSQENTIDAPIEANLRALAYYETALAESGSRFAIDLFHQLNKAEEPNQFYSPYSIHQALSMTMNGNRGDVLDEFRNILWYEGLSLEEANRGAKELTDFLLQLDAKVNLKIANGIWYKKEYDVKVPFRETAQQYYGAEIAPLDMLDPKSVHVINKWIEQRTNHLIKDMLDEIPSNAVMYLVNAIHFKADWKYQFVASKTQKQPFYPSPGRSVQVDMMDLEKAATFKSYMDSDITYIEIPYSTGQYTMGVLYNREGDLSKAAKKLTFENLEKWKAHSRDSNFILKMPKFKLRQKMANMSTDLQAMGLKRPFYFHPDNFTELFHNPTDELKISRVIHDALIEVDEKGSEAAAATVVEIIERVSYPPSGPQELLLDKPFIFFIQEAHSGAILFMGKLGDPSLL